MGKKKGGRGSGGGRQYVTSAEDLEARNERHELAAKARAVRRAGSDDEGSDEKEEEEEKEEDSRAFQMQQMREAAVETESAKAPKPKGGAQGVIDVQNPNAGGAKHMKAKDMTSEPTVELSRREREELEKQRSKEDYERRHKEGKTDEFKKDMERLQQAKKRREEEEAKRASVAKANEEAQSRAKASTAAGAGLVDDDENEKLDPREVKKMNGKQLKERLKERGLSTQGQKAELIARLLGEEL